jgi:transposase
MTAVRKRHDGEFKKKVALEAIRQQKTINQITSEYGVHATQVNQWKKQATEAIGQAFGGGKKRAERDLQQEVDELHRQLGQVVSERDWLKKKSTTCHWKLGER